MDKILYRLETYLKYRMTRSGFLRLCVAGLLAFISENALLKWAFAKNGESEGRTPAAVRADHDIVVAKGGDPYANTVKAVAAMGGMGRFVKEGAIVVIKPNMAWDRNPAQAANTDPQVVAALVEMCYQTGARRVNVFDIPCNDDRRVYENSGIQAAAQAKGANVYFADHWNVVKAKFNYSSTMQDWPVLRDAAVCDTFINVPVLKHHGLTGLTLSLKNLMGVCSGKRGMMHLDIGNKLVDLVQFVKPDLTVIDATRVLMRNGPSGGNLADVKPYNTIIAGVDPVLTDVYACRLVEVDPMTVPYLQVAAMRGVGRTDLNGADVFEIAA